MSYEGFEVREGEVLERVEALCRHLTTGGSFTDSGPIPLGDVERHIDDAYYWMLGELAVNGFSTDTITDERALKVLGQIQSLDAAIQVESSQPTTDEGEESGRFKGLVARRDRMVRNYLGTAALEYLGVTRERDRSAHLELTGRSRSRKQAVYQDTDIVPPRFPRGFGQNGQVPARSGTDTGYTEEQ